MQPLKAVVFRNKSSAAFGCPHFVPPCIMVAFIFLVALLLVQVRITAAKFELWSGDPLRYARAHLAEEHLPPELFGALAEPPQPAPLSA